MSALKPPARPHRLDAPRACAILLVAGAALLGAGLLLTSGGDPAPTVSPASGEVGTGGRSDGERTAADGSSRERSRWPRVEWRHSRSVGAPTSGRLLRGVQLPREGRSFFTWDPIRRTSPNRSWRRYGTDTLVRLVLRVLREHRVAHPRAARVGVGDLSRPRGGDFGVRYGIVGHASHQNGLDVDVYYPRRDGRERAPRSASEIDRRRSQELVDRFVGGGAARVFVGPATGLTGPRGIVEAVSNHDNHLHVRIDPRLP